jgi:tetratricopeptide (TPR) repeat protein
MMVKILQDRLRGLQLRLMTQDIFAKNAVCDELLQVLKEQDDEHVKNEIRRIIVLPLVDLNRTQELLACIDALLEQKDYELNIVALMGKDYYLRRQNKMDDVLAVHSQMIELGEQYGRKEMLAECYVQRGKVYFELNRVDEALQDFNHAIPFATEWSYYNLVAVAKYYIGLCLMEKGHEELGMEKLREASEIAREQHCSDVAMHTEAYRAMKMLEKGRADVALEILQGWTDEFKLTL